MSSPLPLYRALMRQAKTVNDYNFRMYAIRRVKAGFVKNRTLKSDEATAALHDGRLQLDVLRRQAVLGSLYPSAKSVMES
ncbi:LYR motif-containing protein 4 [Mayamaea pseudoterrestris]|nr:LYR motif-containing protein 4 [Mayamaea pseudoterrestris]